MREMKDSGVSWIGEIPEKWVPARLKDIKADKPYAIVDGPFGSAIATSDYRDDGIPLIRITNLNSGEVGSTDLVYITAEHAKVVERSRIYLHDIVFAKTGATIGKCAINESYDYAILASSCVKVSIHPQYDYKYFYHFFSTDQFNVALRNACIGTTRDTINLSPFSRLSVLVPPLKEQHQIAAYLDTKCAKIDAIIARQQQVIEKLKAYKLSVITETVTKGLNPHVPMKDSGIEWIGMIPAHWDILKLQAHTRMLTPMRDRPEKLDGDIPWVRIEDYDGKYISASKEGLGVSPETVREMNLKVYPIGSILCTSSCDLGKCAIVTRELVSNQRFINIIPDSDTNSDYLYYLMLSNAERLNHLSTGTIQANLSRKAFEHLMVQFPPNSEQTEIAEYLDRKCEKIELSINKKQNLIDSLTAYKKSLIYEVVTGKREIDADLPQATTVAVVSPKLLKYMKAVLMARIIDGLGDHVLGRVQVQKGLYFAETSSNPRLHLETNCARYTHGPFDRGIWSYESIMAEHGWIYSTTDEQNHTIYSRGDHFSEYWGEYQRLFPDCEETVQRIIDFVKQFQYTDDVEKVATLFAAWNDFIIDGVSSPTDGEIIAEARNNWTENKKDIDEYDWKESLALLKNAQFIPQGHGKHTVKWQGGQTHG